MLTLTLLLVILAFIVVSVIICAGVLTGVIAIGFGWAILIIADIILAIYVIVKIVKALSKK